MLTASLWGTHPDSCVCAERQSLLSLAHRFYTEKGTEHQRRTLSLPLQSPQLPLFPSLSRTFFIAGLKERVRFLSREAVIQRVPCAPQHADGRTEDEDPGRVFWTQGQMVSLFLLCFYFSACPSFPSARPFPSLLLACRQTASQNSSPGTRTLLVSYFSVPFPACLTHSPALPICPC